MVRSSSVACGSVGDGTVEPEMNAGDGRMLKSFPLDGQVGQKRLQTFEGQAGKVEIGHVPTAGGLDSVAPSVVEPLQTM